MSPSKPIPSSTVIIARNSQTEDSMEIFMVVRHHQIDFASGALVFPGGKVSSSDTDPQLRNYCSGVENCSDEALTLGLAAIRESFEECGILLARSENETQLLSNDSLNKLQHYRPALEKKEVTLLELAQQEKLIFTLEQLHHFAHWVTPELMPKRFDTHFYLTQAPLDQVGSHDGSESVDSIWISPQQALNSADKGELKVIFPTRMNLMRLAQFNRVDDAISNCRKQDVVTIMPWTEQRGSESVLCIPENAGYAVRELPLELVMRS